MTRIESLNASIDILNDLVNKAMSTDLSTSSSHGDSIEQLLEIHQEENETSTAELPVEVTLLLKLLLKLACLQIKNGENPNYTFASVLPKLFHPTNSPRIPEHLPEKYFPVIKRLPSSVLSWKVDKSAFSVDVLKLCILCYEKRKLGTNIAFQVCSVLIPKLVKNLDRTGLTETLKFQILRGMFIV